MSVGNQKKFEYLKGLVRTDNFPHALLISGVFVEKFIAELFGQNLNWKTHPDFIFVEPRDSKEIKIHQVRDLIWRLSLKPSVFPFKVAVIDQCQTMNPEAQSALLKTLEEPKGRVFLILFTDYPDTLFPTLLSRVQKIKFFPEKKEQFENKKILEELYELDNTDIAKRFQYVEKISKSLAIKEILTAWLSYFREKFMMNPDLKKAMILRQIQNAIFLISQTNTNTKLVLENLMLEI
jgi:DNA polymerase-3 subunit delta'